jgi:hypothetical protein
MPNLAGDSREIDEEVAKEWEHTLLQNTMDKELNELNKRLEEKEVCMFASSKHFVMAFYCYLILLHVIYLYWISVKARKNYDCSIDYLFLLEYYSKREYYKKYGSFWL